MKKKIKIDFLVPPFDGHLNPLLELARKIKNENKYEIRFITGKDKNEKVKACGFEVENILLDENEVFEKISNTEKQVKINALELKKQFAENLRLIPKVTEELKSLLKSNKTEIIVSDFIAISAVFCSKELDIPLITTMPTSFAIENKDGTPAYLGGLKPKSSIYGEIRDYFARKQIRIFKKFIYFLFYKEIKKLNFKLYNENGEENLYSQDSILGFGMKEFEFKRSWPKQYISIGYCCGVEESEGNNSEISGLINQGKYKRRVLVSLGTHLNWGKKTLVEDVKKIAEEFQDTLFVITMGKKNSEKENLVIKTENLMVIDYLSYEKYFSCFDYIIHHGGAGITYNAIKYRKPSLVIPHDYDQFDFAARIEYFNIGLRGKSIKNSKNMIKKLNELFMIKEWRNLEKLSEEFHKYKPEKILEMEIERLLKAKNEGLK